MRSIVSICNIALFAEKTKPDGDIFIKCTILRDIQLNVETTVVNLKTEFLLALRFLRPGRNAVSVITVISVLGVTLGVAVLIVVLSVFTGFIDLMREKLLDTRAHVQIYSSYNSPILNPDSVVKAVEETGGKAAPVINMPILMLSEKDFEPKRILAADPAQIRELFKVKTDATLDPGQVWISEEIAKENELKVGQKIHLYTPEKLAAIAMEQVSDDKKTATAKPVKASSYTISGIYSIGKYDFDREIIFMTRKDATTMLDWPEYVAWSVYVWMPDPFNMDAQLEQLMNKLDNSRQKYNFLTWKQLNEQMFGMLMSQKNMMVFIFFFIILIAAFSIGNTLITVVVQKSREIGLLKALGASPGMMMRVFVWEGLLVGVIGSLSGLALGMLALAYRNDFMKFLEKLTGQELFPKEMYYFEELPAHTGTLDVVLIVTMAVVLCTLGGFLPAWRAARLDPAKALRDE